MKAPPEHRIELVLLADQPSSFHFWIETPPDRASRLAFEKEKSVRIAGGALAALLLLLLLSSGTTVILLLTLCGIVLAPLYLVGMVGYFRGG